MPIAPIFKAPFPLLPLVAGVPPILRSGAQIIDTLTFGVFGASDFVNSLIGSEPVMWGVFDENGDSIAEYDSFVSVSYRDDSNVSDYPIENGAFAAYNKVDQPFSVRVALTCGGDVDRRNSFQNALTRARRSLDLFTVLCEDGQFDNCNLIAVDWERRQEQGAHRIIAMCEFQEVRVRGTTAFNTPQSASGYDLNKQGQLMIISDPTIDASGLV